MPPCVVLEERENVPSTFGFAMESFFNIYWSSPMNFNTINTLCISQIFKVVTLRNCDSPILWPSDVSILQYLMIVDMQSLIHLDLSYVTIDFFGPKMLWCTDFPDLRYVIANTLNDLNIWYVIANMSNVLNIQYEITNIYGPPICNFWYSFLEALILETPSDHKFWSWSQFLDLHISLKRSSRAPIIKGRVWYRLSFLLLFGRWLQTYLPIDSLASWAANTMMIILWLLK